MKDLPKIALAGPKGGGKTYLLNRVSAELEFKLQALKLSKDIPPVGTYAFADPIYEAQLDLFDYMNQTNMTARIFNEFLKSNKLDEKIHPVVGISPRNFRQQYGTEFARRLNKDIWVKIMEEKLTAATDEKNPSSGMFILDVRFPNEIKMCTEYGFWIVYVNAMDAPEDGSHDSESHNANNRTHSNIIIDDKEGTDKVVTRIVEMLLEYIGERYTDAGLIVPKGKLN